MLSRNQLPETGKGTSDSSVGSSVDDYISDVDTSEFASKFLRDHHTGGNGNDYVPTSRAPLVGSSSSTSDPEKSGITRGPILL